MSSEHWTSTPGSWTGASHRVKLRLELCVGRGCRHGIHLGSGGTLFWVTMHRS
jgi:hypothetical protein